MFLGQSRNEQHKFLSTLTEYQTFLKTLFSLNRFEELKTDLSGPLSVSKALGHPENEFISVHIAGSNGKGTVAYKMAAVLEENGYRVGLFTSPHLITYRERIQINRQMISEKEVVEGLKKILPLFKTPKFFEVTTLLAFDYFAKKEVDIAIIETGLGGRLDATNIITPLVSIITSVEEEHTSILGKTLEKIALEKSGIIKPNIPVVIGRKAAFQPILSVANPLYIVRNDSIKIAQKGLKLIPFYLKKADGLMQNPPCRYEKHGDVILDVAHNPPALMRLFEKIKRDFFGRKIYVLFGMSKDKDIPGALKVVQAYADHVAFLPSTHPRLFSFPKPSSAEEVIRKGRAEGAILVATGSFYIMKDMRLLLESLKSPA